MGDVNMPMNRELKESFHEETQIKVDIFCNGESVNPGANNDLPTANETAVVETVSPLQRYTIAKLLSASFFISNPRFLETCRPNTMIVL